jgi:predicted nucleic acid-binding protein
VEENNLNKIEVWLDANIIIYFLTQHAEFSEPARQLVFEATEGKITLKLIPLILNEVAFVLTGKVFNQKKSDVILALKSFINLKGIDCEEKSVVEETLDLFGKGGIDFADAYLTAHAKAVTPAHVVSHNVKDFLKLGIKVQTPRQLLDKQ